MLKTPRILRRASVALAILSGAVPTVSNAAVKSQIVTYRCRFTTGARAGQIEDFSKFANVSPALVGAACQDGAGSAGIAVANGPDFPPPQRPAIDANGVFVLASGLTWTCKFDKGPRVGTSQQFRPPYMPFHIGADCADGAGSSGVAIAQ